MIYDTGLIRSIDGAHELHLDLSGVNALRIELYAGNKRWGTVSRIFLSGAVRDKSVPSALPQPIPPERPDTIRLVDLAKRYVASNWSAPEGNFSDFTTDSVSDPRGNTYAGCLYFGMSKHNESAPWQVYTGVWISNAMFLPVMPFRRARMTSLAFASMGMAARSLIQAISAAICPHARSMWM